jgi:effector-binding domain-containing protein
MLKIGDFSALAHVSIATLRYYDQAGLLTPARIDSQTGYRYYAAHQLSRLHRILVLRDFGLSLEQIGEMLHAGVTAVEMRGMLKLQLAEQERRVREEGDRLSRLSSRIRLIEKENDMAYDVVIKSLPKLRIASVREVVPTYPAIGALYPKVAERMGPKMAQVGISVAIWHDKEHKERDVDAEAGFVLRGDVGRVEGVNIYDLLETTAAFTVHNGAYQRLSEAYDALLKWVAENGYEISGPVREMYVHMTKPVRQDDESYVTEIQVPVKKAA